MHVVMILSNPFRPDIRVLKEASSLAENGFQVSIICWDRLGEFPLTECINGIEIFRIRVNSIYSRGSSQLIFLWLFWIKAFIKVNQLKPEIIHCHDLDTAFIGYGYSIIHKIDWIFDAHECYPEQMRQQVNLYLYKILLRFERFIAKRTSLIITVNRSLFERLKNFNSNVFVVGNYSRLPIVLPKDIIFRNDYVDTKDDLIVIYIGGFTNGREIIPLIQSSQFLNNVKIILAGDGPQINQIKNELRKHSTVLYLGWIRQDMIYHYYRIADIIYYGLNPSNKNNEFSTPNTLFLSMAFGKPIITTNVGEVANIVRDENCGLVIKSVTPDCIADAINLLKSDEIRKALGHNAHIAGTSKYNWDKAEKVLLEAYSNFNKH